MNYVMYIVFALVAAFLGYNFFKKDANEEDIQKEIEYKVNDALMEQEQKTKEEKLLALQKKYEEAKKKNEGLSKEEIEEYWNDEDS
ncbi:MAG: hypothetical protein COB41_00485 [Proteobacteria bacterium]|nr:MAG: hypothetical protein COB41_00485 [Pseudomonadota bacterium]